MTSDRQDGSGGHHLRYVLAGVTAFDAILLAVFASQAAAEGRLHGSPASGLAAALASTPCLAVLTVVAVGALVLFARGGGPSPRGWLRSWRLGWSSTPSPPCRPVTSAPSSWAAQPWPAG